MSKFQRDDADAEYARAMLEMAGRTLSAMVVHGCYPARVRSNMPEYIHSADDAYGWEDAEDKPPRATQKQIDQLEDVVEWILAVPDMTLRRMLQKRLIWNWRRDKPALSTYRLAGMFGCSQTHVRRIIKSAEKELATCIRWDLRGAKTR